MQHVLGRCCGGPGICAVAAACMHACRRRPRPSAPRAPTTRSTPTATFFTRSPNSADPPLHSADAAPGAATAATAGLDKARQQLQVAGKLVVWLLHVANRKLLNASSELRLCGVVAVQYMDDEEEKSWQASAQEVDVSCPRLGASGRAAMRLTLQRF